MNGLPTLDLDVRGLGLKHGVNLAGKLIDNDPVIGGIHSRHLHSRPREILNELVVLGLILRNVS